MTYLQLGMGMAMVQRMELVVGQGLGALVVEERDQKLGMERKLEPERRLVEVEQKLVEEVEQRLELEQMEPGQRLVAEVERRMGLEPERKLVEVVVVEPERSNGMALKYRLNQKRA